MGYKLDMDAIAAPKQTQEETVTLDDALTGMTQTHMKHNTLMAISGSVAALDPTSDTTLLDITLDTIGAEIGEDGEVKMDDAEFEYAVDVTMDFAEALGMSQSAILDMYDADSEVALDEIQNFAGMINASINEEGDIANLVTAHIHFDSIVADFAADEEIEEGVTLDNVTLDWSFAKKKTKRKAKTGTGHTMKTVECHRTVDGVRKKGFCRYPKSLLHGKYKKASGVSPKQKTHLAQMVTDAHTAQAERRRALNVKLTREGRSKSKSASKASSRSV
ncbi:hypothetical protein [Sulfurovum sp.]|uniref:hypothetical protein n=1 Tax=Sulfurovum sp. TaxID=1969726 RepID=UPI0025EACD6F|nr:hypothetical protein [Sulfurovum sp.]